MFVLYPIYFDNKTHFPHWWIAFLGDYGNVFFSTDASLTGAHDWLADWRSNINSVLSCRLCVMASHINHPQWLLTPCRKSWPSGLRVELWGCILFYFLHGKNENEGSLTRKVKLGWFHWFFLHTHTHTHTHKHIPTHMRLMSNFLTSFSANV